ncbi:MAG: TRAP transporter substrate-binding protein [Archangium sp.]|nr:TRAP transporter substrate-binding protein [Archangium sp.]MDP3151296.1 TRAP transporter substrate-binding protein [Archangium sp.]MDP3571647.1 TRAP transporter substrate-binding protein [Archangium sp.]
MSKRALLCLCLFALTAQAQTIAKVGSVAPEGTPWAEWLDGVKARLEKDTGNKLKLKVFLGGKLGGEKEMVEETRNGNLHLFGGSTGAVATYVPELNVLELPFIFTSDAEADFVLDKLRDRFGKLLEAKGFVMVMWAENGWHGYGVKGKCIEKVEDMKGLKMRSQESYVHIETYKAFGASPVEMAVPEVLGALQTGTVDGYSNTPLFSFATSWYNGITNFAYTKHIYQPALMVISKKWFDQQPEDLKKALMVRSDERAGIEGVRALSEPLLENFKAAGKNVCRLTPEATKGFSARVKPVWDAFAKKAPGNKAILDAVLAAKKEFAAKK